MSAVKGPETADGLDPPTIEWVLATEKFSLTTGSCQSASNSGTQLS